MRECNQFNECISYYKIMISTFNIYPSIATLDMFMGECLRSNDLKNALYIYNEYKKLDKIGSFDHVSIGAFRDFHTKLIKIYLKNNDNLSAKNLMHQAKREKGIYFHTDLFHSVQYPKSSKKTMKI
mmetsp:Transcript_63772/g.77974  ORF Transcript_63772/g.77974 Transcript_63772/m.77974 type:complete len:126 (-) Transcript_63772:155-532(-)